MVIHSLSLCAGVGGLDLGLHLATGAETVCYVERDAYAASVIVARMEDKTLAPAVVWDCLESFDGRPWCGVVDIITSGDPCQPFSVAGQRRGEADKRYVWDDIARIIGEVEPEFVFLENVPGAIDFRWDCKAELEGMGYRVEAGLFSAEEVGAPHQRVRLFLLAVYPSSFRRGRWVNGDSGRGKRPPETEGHSGELANTESTEWRGPSREDNAGGRSAEVRGHGGELADTRKPGREECGRPGLPGEKTGRINEGPAVDGDGVLGLFPPGPSDLEAWREVLAVRPELAPAIRTDLPCSLRERNDCGFARANVDCGASGIVQQEAQPAICGVASGFAYRNDRLRCLGNSVVPLTAALAFVTLWQRLKNR